MRHLTAKAVYKNLIDWFISGKLSTKGV